MATATRNLEQGVDYGVGKVPLATLVKEGYRQVPVEKDGIVHQVWVVDNGLRPPTAGGMWLDDLVSEACRRVFGVDRGSARPRVNANPLRPLLEFREFWPDPLVGKFVQLVEVEVENEYGNSYDKKACRVSCRVVPGADVESVLRAEVYANCRRVLGPGVLRVPTPSRFVYRTQPENTRETQGAPAYCCRYTVLKSGVPHEVMIELPPTAGSSWREAVSAVERECRKRWGSGRLTYSPEHSETSFTWS